MPWSIWQAISLYSDCSYIEISSYQVVHRYSHSPIPCKSHDLAHLVVLNDAILVTMIDNDL